MLCALLSFLMLYPAEQSLGPENQAFVDAMLARDASALEQALQENPSANLDKLVDFAASKGRSKSLRKLIEHGAHYNGSESRSLHYAAWNGHKKTAQMLITLDRDNELFDYQTAFVIAAQEGHESLLTLFYENHLDVESVELEAFLSAARFGHKAVMIFFLKKWGLTQKQVSKKITKICKKYYPNEIERARYIEVYLNRLEEAYSQLNT